MLFSVTVGDPGFNECESKRFSTVMIESMFDTEAAFKKYSQELVLCSKVFERKEEKRGVG